MTWLRIAPFPVLLLFLMVFGQAQSVAGQGYWPVVYGDRTTKKYYAPECAEVEKIDQANRQGFKNPAAAEKAGFVKGDTCTSSTTTQPRGIQFFGDKSKKLFYPESCTGKVSIPLSDLITFTSDQEPEKLGYKVALCLETPAAQQSPTRVKVSPMKQAKLPRIIAITSEPSEWLGKQVTVDAAVNITDRWRFDSETYAFTIDDGSASFYIYMEKKAAKPLRDLILKQPAADGVYGKFTFYLNPAGYLLSGELYGRLVSYSVRAD